HAYPLRPRRPQHQSRTDNDLSIRNPKPAAPKNNIGVRPFCRPHPRHLSVEASSFPWSGRKNRPACWTRNERKGRSMNNHKTRRPRRGLTFAAATGVALAAGMLFAPVAAHADTKPSHFTWTA